MADVEQLKKIVPFVTCEITFGQSVCELMFGINVSNLTIRIKISWLEFVFTCLTEELPTGFSVALLHLWFCWFGLVRNEILQSQIPKDRERESHPCVNLHREKSPQLQ